MTNELATIQDDMFSDARVQMIRDQVAKGAPDYIFAAMLDLAKRRRLDPLAKQISLIKFGGTWTIITTIDGYRAIAEQTGQYAGQDAPAFIYTDPPTKNKNGKTEPQSVTVTVYKLLNGVAFPFSATIYFEEYSTNSNNWLSMPHTMGAKVAESHALRKAFPSVMSGTYTAEEMDQAIEGTAREVTEHVNRQTGEIHSAPPRPTQAPQLAPAGFAPRPEPHRPAAQKQQAKERGPHIPPTGVEFYDPKHPDENSSGAQRYRASVMQQFILTMNEVGMDEHHRAALTWGAGYEGSARNVPSAVLDEWTKKIKANGPVWKNRAEELMVEMQAQQEQLNFEESAEYRDDPEGADIIDIDPGDEEDYDQYEGDDEDIGNNMEDVG